MSSNDCHVVVELAPYSRRENRIRLTPERAAIVRTGDGLLAATLEQILPEPNAADLGPTSETEGGWPDTTFNIIALLFVGTFVETLHGWRILLGVYFLAGIALNRLRRATVEGPRASRTPEMD